MQFMRIEPNKTDVGRFDKILWIKYDRELIELVTKEFLF